MATTTGLRLKEFPSGFPDPSRDFEVAQVPRPSGDLAEGRVRLQLVYVSVDPYMRPRMVPNADSYIPSFKKGAVIDGYAVGKVLESKDDRATPGDYISGFFPWQMIFDHKFLNGLDHVIKADEINKVPLSYYISVLGMPGLTAWLGLMKVCEPTEGETLFVTAASGAVGQLVCQIGKMRGLRVVASAGSDDKCKRLKEELKVDEVFNYKTCGDLNKKLSEVCPKGIDCYFDNVGGEMLDAALLAMNRYGRIAICGAISQYNLTAQDTPYALKHYLRCLTKEIKMQGFIVSSLATKFGIDEAMADVTKGLQSGQIKYQVDEMVGDLSQAPHALIRMLKGENQGKQVVRIVE